MTRDPNAPKWLDSLPAAATPEIPPELLAALRVRRRERLRASSALVAAALIVASGAAWVALSGGTPPRSAPIAELPQPQPAQSVPSVPAPARPGESVTPALVYRDTVDLDRLASAPAAAADRQWRIGDHWDPERVNAWVLD